MVPDDVPPARLGKDAVWFGDVFADFDGLAHGATFVVRIAGRMTPPGRHTVDDRHVG